MIQECHSNNLGTLGTGVTMLMQDMQFNVSSPASLYDLKSNVASPQNNAVCYDAAELYYQQQQQQQPQQLQQSYYQSNYLQQVCNMNLTDTTETQLIPFDESLFSLENEESSPVSQMDLKKAAANTSGISEASTVDESFAYLQGLNSGNLMQCSQQSVVQELLNKESFEMKSQTMSDLFQKVADPKEEEDTKPNKLQNLNVLPTLEEHDIGGYKFQLIPRSLFQGKVSGTYSDKLNKLYVRKDEVFCIDVVYTPKSPKQDLRVRAMLCFTNEVSNPILRCPNHLSKETDVSPPKLNSLLRCENPNVEYCGTANGVGINDRYSVLIPLGKGVVKNSDKSVQQTIALKFACQNSCMGRKDTSMIFLLENVSGEIHAQRVLNVKISSCPKRDRGMEERSGPVRSKRKSADQENCPIPVKAMKQESSGGATVKVEKSSSSDLDDKFDLQVTSSGEVQIKMLLSSKWTAMNAVQSARNMESYLALLEKDGTARRQRKNRIVRRIKSMLEKLENM